MSNFKNECPVPFDQQPLNEYLSLKESWLFSLSISNIKSFVYGFIIIFVFVFVLLGFFLMLLTSQYSISKLLLLNFVISHLIILFLFIRIYLGWSYVIKRLLSATVFYEESGWYDGQVWIKTSSYLIQDRLVGLYQIMPFINRIKYTCFLLVVNLLFFSLFFYHF